MSVFIVYEKNDGTSLVAADITGAQFDAPNFFSAIQAHVSEAGGRDWCMLTTETRDLAVSIARNSGLGQRPTRFPYIVSRLAPSAQMS